MLPTVPAENLLAFGGFGVENAKEKRFKYAFQIIAPAVALAESVEHEVGIATKPAFLLQEMQEYKELIIFYTYKKHKLPAIHRML